MAAPSISHMQFQQTLWQRFYVRKHHAAALGQALPRNPLIPAQADKVP
jgi:hypothetical protein